MASGQSRAVLSCSSSYLCALALTGHMTKLYDQQTTINESTESHVDQQERSDSQMRQELGTRQDANQWHSGC